MEHRKRFKRFHEPGHLHEFTFSCYQRRALLTTDTGRAKLSEFLEQANELHQMDLVAFVYMPEHLHLLVYPRPREPDLAMYLAQIKQPFSAWAKERLMETGSPLLQTLTVQERPGKTCFRLWQEGPGYDRNLVSSKAVMNAIDYIHMNPVRRGLVESAVDWPWSSARFFLNEPPRQQYEGLPTIQGAPQGLLD